MPLAEAGAVRSRAVGRSRPGRRPREAAADGLAMTFAPMLDVSRDPRWGRIVEGPGEDPWLGARLADAKVRGFQGLRLGGRRVARGGRQALLCLRTSDRGP